MGSLFKPSIAKDPVLSLMKLLLKPLNLVRIFAKFFPSIEIMTLSLSLHADAPSPLLIKVLMTARNSITLSFEGQSDETPVSGYIINYKSHQDNWEELKVTGRRSHHVLENLRCGTKYQMTVTSFNTAGRSLPSDLITASTAGSGMLTLSFHANV